MWVDHKSDYSPMLSMTRSQEKREQALGGKHTAPSGTRTYFRGIEHKTVSMDRP